MSGILGPAIVWQPDDYIFFKRCGEITISPDIQNIGFNCLFCSGICLQNEIFLQHVQEHHKEEVFKLYENQNFITLNDQESALANNMSAELLLNISDVNLSKNTNNALSVTNNVCITSNQLQNNKNQQLKANCVNLNAKIPMADNLPPTSDLHYLVHDLETNDLLSLTSPNQDLENLITLTPYENTINNITTFSGYTSTLTSNDTSTFNIPSNCISASSDILECLPADNECEIGDGEDSGIMLVQSPCQSDCCGLSDCMLFTEDSSSKSTHNFTDNQSADCIKRSEMQSKPEESANCSRGKYFKTPAMRKALNNKDLIKYLLEAYRRNEKLWNPNHPSYKYNAPRSIYKELSQPLLNDQKCHLTGEEIFGIITQLKGRYRRELKKFEVRKGKHKTRLWYFEELEFLRHIIEAKRKERDKDKNDSKAFKAKDKDLTNRQILSYLLELYRQHECLWNPKDKEYLTCNKTDLFNMIATQVKEKLHIDMTHAECLSEIQKLRIRYHKELRILYKLKGLYLPKLWCFDELEFLRPVIEEKIAKNLNKINHRTLLSPNQRKRDLQKVVEIKFVNLEQQLKFIEIYRNYNCLWNVNHLDYRSIYYHRKTLNEMLEMVNLTFKHEKNFSLEQLEKTLYALRKDFSKEKHKRLTQIDFSRESGMSFVLYEKLNEFLGRHLGPFRCDNCQQICKTFDRYKIHKSQHDGTMPFICTLCGKGFQMPGNLTVHIRRHRKDFPYSCEICKKSFATSTELSIHMRSHTGERPYACESCDKTFKTWSFYDLHRRTHLNQSNFHCPICDKSFYERNRFTDHMNIHLNIRKHQCEECGKGFTTVGNLKKHSDLHASVKKYKCQLCDKSFAQFASLRWHRKTQHEQ